MAAAEKQREWYLQDRVEERQYNEAREDEARAYDRAQLDETRQYSRQVISNLVEDAEAAGFNPLTVMRSGGASSYNASAGLAPLSATRLTSSPSQLSTVPSRQAVGGSSVGSAAGAVGDFLSNFDPFADTKKEQEYRLVESQIAALNASALSGASRGSASYASSDFERRLSGQGAALSKGGTATLVKRGTGAGDNGEILNAWTDWYDRDGKIISLPNPNLPETEQFMVEPAGKLHNAIVRPIERDFKDAWITRRDLTPAEKKRVEDSWLPAWVPRFSYKSNR
ncbi:hypothetical protein H4S14_000290 [Agrobacterium vitis]|nr:hypothetical protein [Agrobacterium vitis]MBE1436563.1 hypothetical protein [Agrobacterium vitis]